MKELLLRILHNQTVLLQEFNHLEEAKQTEELIDEAGRNHYNHPDYLNHDNKTTQ